VLACFMLDTLTLKYSYPFPFFIQLSNSYNKSSSFSLLCCLYHGSSALSLSFSHSHPHHLPTGYGTMLPIVHQIKNKSSKCVTLFPDANNLKKAHGDWQGSQEDICLHL
jgi:hypothetical protein